MSKLLAVSCVVFAACATGGVGAERQTAPHTNARLEMMVTGATSKTVAAHNPKLPSADRISGEIRSGLGAVASADVDLCIAPDGHVQGLKLVRGSSLAAFDAAIVHDMRDWQFASTFSSNLRTCQSATITYHLDR
jgi:azurin